MRLGSFGVLAPENSAKWDSIEPSRNSFNFANFDTLVNFAKTNSKLIRGHTLVWHSQLPSWVSAITDKATLQSVIENHIKTILTRYKGQIYAWDVVNEVIDDSTGNLRDSVFSRVLGETFIDIAFKAARAADPAAKLYINDYSLDGSGTKLTAMVNLINRLKSRSVPIDGVGTQAHLILGQVGGVQTALNSLAGTGLDVAITELDIRIPKNVTSDKLTQQQTDFNTVTKACLAVSKCVGITAWGVSDKNSWVDSTFPTYDSPLLWDDYYNRKLAYTETSSAFVPFFSSSSFLSSFLSFLMKVATVACFLFLPCLTMASLASKMKAKGKLYFGTALDVNTLNDSTINQLAGSEFSAYTPENSAKWDHIEPQRNNFTYSNFDSVVNFAQSHGGIVRGHTLVWHNALPLWVGRITNATELQTVIENHITNIVSHYKGRIYAWDVVNEVLNEDGSLRDSIFSRVLGEKFIDIAFKAARAADPNAKLYINDYGLDRPDTAKINAMVALIKRLESRGVPLDGVGTQTHIVLYDAAGVKTALQQLAAAWHIEIAITELDIRIPTPVTSDKLARQEQDFSTVVQACLAVPKCIGISTWGVSDKYSWVQPDSTPGYDSPLLWGDNYSKKPAYSGVDAALAETAASSVLVCLQVGRLELRLHSLSFCYEDVHSGSTNTPHITPISNSLMTSTVLGKKLFSAYSTRFINNKFTTNQLHFVAPEYSAKWSHIHPQRNEFTFAAFDSVVDFAEKRGGIIRGHTLIWHNSLPQWVKDVNNATELRSIIEHHITTIVSRYKGRIYAWDVVNEIFKDDGSLRDSVFSRVLGDEFVEIAFNAAHAADPNAKLYINDYGLDRANNPKINALVKLVKHLKSNGVPLDGVGSQTHLTLGGAGTVKGALEQLAAAWKIEIAITELDIRVPTPVTNDKLVRQQQEYNTVVKACLEIPKCVGISIWGISDKASHTLSFSPDEADVPCSG
ncbi:glycoside hydrolase superfamily [Auriculariales sp. MPI-PUGE-AT-0066]|nr:glycoside hydrolase superfamily [Auriculariales sp. MPI-PUGE-AT-0066]